MARISDLAKLEQPAENNVFPVSDGTLTSKITFADLRSAIVKQASQTTLGSVRVGQGLLISDTGVLSVRNFSGYVLPPASSETLGGIRIGSGLTMSETSVLSVDYSIPTASSVQLGGVKIGSGITINNGVISVQTANISGGNLGDIPYQLSTSSTTLLPGNITSIKKFLAETGTGTTARAPVWSAITATDINLENVTNESKATMFTDPIFTGTVTTTSISAGNSTTRGDFTGNWHIEGQLRSNRGRGKGQWAPASSLGQIRLPGRRRLYPGSGFGRELPGRPGQPDDGLAHVRFKSEFRRRQAQSTFDR
jgi:hypothetical protein